MAKGNSKRHKQQWMLLWIMVITILLGWKYPVLGYSVPIVMLVGMLVSLFRGRYTCGNLCPRGSFLDRVLAKISPQKEIPRFIRTPAFRWSIFVALMGFMMYRGFQNPTSVNHWGYVFWTMCAVTTGVAVVFGLFVNARSWCAFCPIGTVQSVFGGSKEQLVINSESCKSCGLCEKACTFNQPIVQFKDAGIADNPDCLKCSECVTACPTKSLSWPEKVKATSQVIQGKTFSQVS